jgi:hypothetical protein
MSKSHIKSRKITREMAQTDSLHEPLGNFTDSGVKQCKYLHFIANRGNSGDKGKER